LTNFRVPFLIAGLSDFENFCFILCQGIPSEIVMYKLEDFFKFVLSCKMTLLFGDKHESPINPIFKLQEKAVRAISYQSWMYPAHPIFNDLKLLKLPEIFELRLLTFVFDSVKKTSPSCFHDFFFFSSSVHQYSTRHASQSNLYMLQKNSLQYGLKSTCYLGAKLRNILLVEVRNAPSKPLFKTKLKSYILSKVD